MAKSKPKGQTAKKFEVENFGFDKAVRQEPSNLDNAYGTWKRSPDPRTMHQLLRSAAPVISKALTSYAGGDRALSGRAKRLAIDAFKKFDPEKGTKLQTHLLIQLQPLRREYMKRTSPVKIPERIQVDKYHLDMAERGFKEMHSREPSDDELSELTGLSAKRISRLRMFSKGIISEGQTATSEEGVQLPGSEAVTADDIWLEYVHHDLDPIDKKILEWKTGMYGKAVISTNEIARRLGITPSAVSQRASKIAMKIEEGKNLGR
jgi:DNA-directed RNA polymerase specialized sigma subunit